MLHMQESNVVKTPIEVSHALNRLEVLDTEPLADVPNSELAAFFTL